MSIHLIQKISIIIELILLQLLVKNAYVTGTERWRIPHMGGILALLSALGYAFGAVLNRKGLMEENPGNVWEIRFFTSLVTLSIFLIGVSVATLFGFDLIKEFKYLNLTAVLLLLIDGIFGPLIGGMFTIMAVSQIGAAHSSALRGGSNPFFATVLAILFLGERLNLLEFISVLMIIGGIIIVGYRGYEGTIALLEKTRIGGGVFALLAGLSFAFSQIARGAAINLGATPNTAFLVGVATVLIITTVVCRIKAGSFKLLKNINHKSLYYYSFSGLAGLVGRYALLTAFTLIPVWQAVAIRNIQPLLAIFLAWLILKKAEEVNLRLVLGATLTAIGVVILKIY